MSKYRILPSLCKGGGSNYEKKPHPLVLNEQYQVGWKYQANLNEKYMSVLQGILNFESTSCNKSQDIAKQFFYFLLFDISFYISRYYFLQLFRT